MAHPYRFLTEKALDFWLARGAVLTIVILQIIIVNDLSVGPRWLAPVLELALLIPLSIATGGTQRRARKASTDAQWNLVGRQRVMMRRLALSLTALVTLVNFGALARLVEAIRHFFNRIHTITPVAMAVNESFYIRWLNNFW